MRSVFLLAPLLALLLASCATQSTRPVPPADAGAIESARQRQLERESILRGQTDWSLAGRIAISNGRKGGSGRIDWQQQGDAYTVSLSAPVTRQSWRLSGGPQGARLEGIVGGPREGADAAQLLREATGWEIPVAALGDWVRGVSAQGLPQAAMQFDTLGRLSHLEQGGWAIDYRWPEAASTMPALPQRVDAVKGESKVKLIVDEWKIEPVAIRADESDSDLERALAALDTRDPSADMARNVAKGDLRAMGVCGFECVAPGFPDDGLLLPKVEIRLIDDTGDVVTDERHAELKSQAAEYARKYNVALQDWLRRHPQSRAGSSGN